MKKLIISTFFISASLSQIHAQVIIGDATGTATDKTSVLLEFANTNDKGIIMPYVRSTSAITEEGTIILDATDATKARVKYYNGSWVDLSGQDTNITTALADQPTTVQVSEATSSKAIIGSQTSNADGVLVLESKTKAMILPIVTDVNNIPSPSPGMMVYVKGANKRLAVFNGNKWSFWKP